MIHSYKSDLLIELSNITQFNVDHSLYIDESIFYLWDTLLVTFRNGIPISDEILHQLSPVGLYQK
jgi:hypothetical protein